MNHAITQLTQTINSPFSCIIQSNLNSGCLKCATVRLLTEIKQHPHIFLGLFSLHQVLLCFRTAFKNDFDHFQYNAWKTCNISICQDMNMNE